MSGLGVSKGHLIMWLAAWGLQTWGMQSIFLRWLREKVKENKAINEGGSRTSVPLLEELSEALNQI